LKKAVAWNGLNNSPRRQLTRGLDQADCIEETRAVLPDNSRLGLPFKVIEKEGFLAISRMQCGGSDAVRNVSGLQAVSV